ncbi:MAG TPA: PPC domain-containing protein [Kofleriaceae bacterium]|jgi:hypothetical protein
MLRELFVLAPIAVVGGGCTSLLDFSDDKIPVDAADAMVDAFYTQAECAYGEPNDAADAAFVVTTADMGPAAICPGDVADFYKFTVPDGTTTVTVAANFTNSVTGDLDLKLYDATGTTVLGASLGFGDGESITCPGQSPMCSALTTGDYVFEVYPATPGNVNVYTLALTIQ